MLFTTKNYWGDHLVELERVLIRLAEAGLKVNANKSFFGRYKYEYLGFWVTHDDIRPLVKNVEATTNLQSPKTVKQVQMSVGIVSYYQDMLTRYAHTFMPLKNITASNTKFKCTEVYQKAFEKMKRLVGKDSILAHPNFSKEFGIHTDASKKQLGSVIPQENGQLSSTPTDWHPHKHYIHQLSAS